MHLVDVLTINEDPDAGANFLKTVWTAFEYFPKGIWDGVNYVGNRNLDHDFEMKSEEKTHGALLFSRLLRRTREMKRRLGTGSLLLAITHDPVIVTYCRFELDKLVRVVNIVHDYVSDNVGVISLFEIDAAVGPKIAAHGLGHNRGLAHHSDPIDLMYVNMLHDYPLIEKDGFCEECHKKLRRKAGLFKR